MSSTLRQAKAILRKEINERLKTLTAKDISLQSNVVVKKALDQDDYKNSSRISIYLPIPGEIDTLPLLQRMFQDGKHCFIPHYEEHKSMIMVELKSWEEYEALPTNSWSIKQPTNFDASKDATLTGGLDLIFMPGLAFTPQGARLGRGKGYYDIYLDHCIQQGKRPKTIGLAFKEQILENIPMTDHDIVIDKVVFPLSHEIDSA